MSAPTARLSRRCAPRQAVDVYKRQEGNRGFLSLVRLCVLSSYKERTCPKRVSCAPKGDERQKREAPVKGNFSLVWITSFETVQNENGRPPLEKRLPFCLYMLLCDFFRFGEFFRRPLFCYSRKRLFLNNVGCDLYALYIRLRRDGDCLLYTSRCV